MTSLTAVVDVHYSTYSWLYLSWTNFSSPVFIKMNIWWPSNRDSLGGLYYSDCLQWEWLSLNTTKETADGEFRSSNATGISCLAKLRLCNGQKETVGSIPYLRFSLVIPPSLGTIGCSPLNCRCFQIFAVNFQNCGLVTDSIRRPMVFHLCSTFHLLLFIQLLEFFLSICFKFIIFHATVALAIVLLHTWRIILRLSISCSPPASIFHQLILGSLHRSGFLRLSPVPV